MRRGGFLPRTRGPVALSPRCAAVDRARSWAAGPDGPSRSRPARNEVSPARTTRRGCKRRTEPHPAHHPNGCTAASSTIFASSSRTASIVSNAVAFDPPNTSICKWAASTLQRPDIGGAPPIRTIRHTRERGRLGQRRIDPLADIGGHLGLRPQVLRHQRLDVDQAHDSSNPVASHARRNGAFGAEYVPPNSSITPMLPSDTRHVESDTFSDSTGSTAHRGTPRTPRRCRAPAPRSSPSGPTPPRGSGPRNRRQARTSPSRHHPGRTLNVRHRLCARVPCGPRWADHLEHQRPDGDEVVAVHRRPRRQQHLPSWDCWSVLAVSSVALRCSQ